MIRIMITSSHFRPDLSLALDRVDLCGDSGVGAAGGGLCWREEEEEVRDDRVERVPRVLLPPFSSAAVAAVYFSAAFLGDAAFTPFVRRDLPLAVCRSGWG